jgi:hypothetical protein
MSTKTRRLNKAWRPGGQDPAHHNRDVRHKAVYRRFNRALQYAARAMRRLVRSMGTALGTATDNRR